MIVKLTSKRQVTFPKRVMERFCLREGETLLISETPDGILIKPQRFDVSKLAPLRDKVLRSLPEPNIEEMRYAAFQEDLRD